MAEYLRPELNKHTSRDEAGNEVTITETDITPYMMIPGLAEMEAEGVKERYGGSSIQDSQKKESAGPAPYEKPTAAGMPLRQFPRRSEFEQSIFKQLKSPLSPTGNPFEINVPKSVDQISKQDLPALFRQVFGNQVTWEDRRYMTKDQKEHWLEEAKKYRAHLKERVEAEKQGAIDQYNMMMTRFTNEKKEYEAALKTVKERTEKFMKRKKEKSKEARTKKKDEQALIARKTELLKDMNKVTKDLYEAEAQAATEGKPLDAVQVKGYTDQVNAIRSEIQRINQHFGQGKIDMSPKGMDRVKTGEHEKRKLKAKEGGSKKQKGEYNKVKPFKKEKKVKRVGVHKETGRKAIQYEDGTIEYVD